MSVILLYFLAFLTVVLSTNPSVTVIETLDDQLPSVARIGQPFSWTFSPSTFNSSDGTLTYSASSLPSWMSFDESFRTFRGTPSANDVGYPKITVFAHASGSSASSEFTVCVSNAPPPTLNIPISVQFRPDSRSLSSVFFLRPNSALATPNPAVRVPRKWSFSIGFESNTFTSPNSDIFYELRLANGSVIPDYMNFDSKTVTLDGMVPSEEYELQPLSIPFNLHASDEEGYTSAMAPFDVIVADRELHLVNDLPTLNITYGAQFVVSLQAAVDYTGVYVDDNPIQPSNITKLDIDVSSYSSWLQYDAPSRTLSGNPGNEVIGSRPLLPVIITTDFNQTIKTQVALALVESYFAMSNLPSVNVSKGDQVQFNLAEWFSRPNQGFEQTSLSAGFEPSEVANFLRFDEASKYLEGSIPLDYQSPVDHCTVTFTAYSHVTHSTSKTNLPIYIAGTGNTKSLVPTKPNDLSSQVHKRFIMAIILTFGVIGGMCTLAGIFSIVRRWARVPDTAILGEEGRYAWSEKDKRWYGLTSSPQGMRVIERVDDLAFSHILSSSMLVHDNAQGSLGLGLGRVAERIQQRYTESPPSSNPRFMTKKEFLSRIKETVRKVSGKYAPKHRTSTPRLVIGKPILLPSSSAANYPTAVPNSPSNPFEDMIPPSRPGSTFMSGSPSGSTAEQSIPRRRPDFAPPKSMAQVHFNEGSLARQVSTGSMGANSFRSGKSGLSGDSYGEGLMGPPTRPRLVPFTSSTRVPVPQFTGASNSHGKIFVGNRIASQKAKICKVDSRDNSLIRESLKPSTSTDELSMGIHYVRSFGADKLTVDGASRAGSTPPMTNLRSSFTSLESSHLGLPSKADPMRVLVRVGERFKFRLPIPLIGNVSTKGYSVKLISGQKLPKFIHSDINGISTKRALEFSGVATFRDLGEITVGVFLEKDNVCVASVIVEVVGKR